MPAGFDHCDGILAMGGELKNTFCMVAHGQAIVSQHMGDMEARAALLDAEQNLELYKKLFDFEPELVAVDRHPEYLPTKQALRYTDANRVIPVQHHHAHVAACLAEHGRPLDGEPVLGIVLDGLGYGEDGELWGGEFLVADYRAYRRTAHFMPVALPGGVKAMREPWRNTWAHLDAAFGWDTAAKQYADLECVRWLAEQPVATFTTMREKGINSPLASSAGRLFDALAGALDICRERQSHEAEAAMALEALARPAMSSAAGSAYPIAISPDAVPVLSFAPLWRAVLDDLGRATPPGLIAARFHAGLAAGIAAAGIALARRDGLGTVVLSGGVFQNELLCSGVQDGLRAAGLEVLIPVAYPANDGGLSLGQAAIAAAVGSGLT
jgi:hydrogenase maturation protein HypF